MTARKCLIAALFTALPLAGPAVWAQTSMTLEASVTPRTQNPVPFVQTPTAEWSGKITTGGKTIPYKLVISETPHRDAKGQVIASLVSFAYLRTDRDPAGRPVTFIYGGGPGGGVQMLLGGLAPRSIFPSRGADGLLHYPDNPDTLLEASDLVFVDGVGNGYSRVLDDTRAAELIGVRPDARVMTGYVETWLKANNRQASPKFLLGESYGGVRTAMMAKYLAAEGVNLDGVIQISPMHQIVDLTQTRGVAAPLEQWLPNAIPTFALTARHLGKGAYTHATPVQTLAAARAFAEGPYQRVFTAPILSQDERAEIAAQLSRLTGLPTAFLLSKDLKLGIPDFRDNLFGDQGLRLGGSDARERGVKALRDKLGPPYDDPSMHFDDDTLADAWVQKTYGFRAPERYIRFAGFVAVNWKWDMDDEEKSMPAVFAELMRTNPRFGLLVEAGEYDLRLPWRGTEGAFRKQGFPAGRYTFRLFPAGHSIYEDLPSRPAANKAIRDFIVNQSAPSP